MLAKVESVTTVNWIMISSWRLNHKFRATVLNRPYTQALPFTFTHAAHTRFRCNWREDLNLIHGTHVVT